MVASSLIRELLDRQDSNLNLEVSYNIHLRKLFLLNFLTGDDIWQQRRIDERFAASFIAEIQTPVQSGTPIGSFLKIDKNPIYYTRCVGITYLLSCGIL